MGEQLGTGRTPETLPGESPPLQEGNSEITNLNNDTRCWNQEGRRGKWSIFRARGGKDSLGFVRREAGGIWSSSTRFSASRKFKGHWKTKLLALEIQQPPPGTPENLPDTTATSPNPRTPPRHRWAETNLRDMKIKEWCIKRCGNCNLSFSTVNLWILMTGSHLHLTISVLEHFLGTGGIFLSQ